MGKKIKLGDVVEDKVTGFKGIVTVVSEYLNGCCRMGVQPRVDKDGKVPDSIYVDEPQLRHVEEKPELVGEQKTGGPRPDPQRAPDPQR